MDRAISPSVGNPLAPTDLQEALVRGLAHRMNNILSLFHGYLGLLFDNETLDPGTRAGLTQIRQGAEEAAELMNRAKSLARPAAAVWRELDLRSLLERQRSSYEEWLPAGSSLHVECPEDLPVLWTDAPRLRTALLELVRNAAEACPISGGIVRVEVKKTGTSCAGLEGSTEGLRPIDALEIAVSDNGPGIPAAAMDRIFQPFYTTKSKRHAAGLGLSVALGLAQQLGGGLRCETGPDGATFRLLLPLVGGDSAKN